MGTRGKERNTATILLVEGEPNQCRLYQMELEEEGYHVMSASDGKEALQAVEGERPDLVVLDLHIPGMDGVEALGRLLSADSSLPVIIHSAYEGFKDNFTAWSADAYLVKSSNLDGLKQEIQRVLAERARVAGGSAPA